MKEEEERDDDEETKYIYIYNDNFKWSVNFLDINFLRRNKKSYIDYFLRIHIF